MRVTRSLLAIAALLIVGCSGSDDGDSSGSTNPKGFTPPQEAPPNTVGGFSALIPETTLAPGDEIEPCWILPLEIEGPSRFVAAASVTTNAGMHHGNVTTRKKTAGEGVRPCGPDDNPGVFGGEAGDIFNG